MDVLTVAFFLAAVATILAVAAPTAKWATKKVTAYFQARRLEREQLREVLQQLRLLGVGSSSPPVPRAGETGQIAFPVSPHTPERQLNDLKIAMQQLREERTRDLNEVSTQLEQLEMARDALQAEDKKLTGFIASFYVGRDPATGAEVYLDIPEIAARVDKLAADLQVLQTMQYALLSRVMSPEETGLLHSALALAERIRADVAGHPDLEHRFVGVQVVDNPVSGEHPHKWSVQVLDGYAHGLPVYVVTWGEWESVKALGFVEAEGSAL
jgi:hypothetical protein